MCYYITMSFHDGYPEPPKAQDIELQPENAEMLDRLRSNVQRVLSSDFTDTVEVTDTKRSEGLFALPQPKYLARVAFMKMGLTDLETRGDAAAPDFRLAVVAKAHGLDAETAAYGDDEELKDRGFVWPDGVDLQLLDYRYHNSDGWRSTYQRSFGFDVTGWGSGFVEDINPKGDFLRQALGIDDSWDGGGGLDQDGLDSLEQFRVIDGVLTNGRIDTDAHTRLRSAAGKTESNFEVVTHDLKVIQGSQPHFSKLIESALSIDGLRDMVAWQQYWHDRRGQI